MSDATQATRQPANSLALIFGGVAAGGFVLLGVLCVAYIFVSVRGPEKPVAGLPVSAGAPIEIAGPEPTPRLSVPPPPELPPEQFVLSQLYQRFQRNRSEVKRAVVGKRIEVDLEDRTWQVEDLNANADGIIELIATQQSAFGVEVHMILRFSQSKDKIASRMQRYAENRRRGETVRFVVTGKLDVEKRRGSEFLVLHDVALK